MDELISKQKALALLQMVVEDTKQAYKENRFVSYQEVAGRCYRLIEGLQPEEVPHE